MSAGMPVNVMVLGAVAAGGKRQAVRASQRQRAVIGCLASLDARWGTRPDR